MKNYIAVIAEYSFGFCGKSIIIIEDTGDVTKIIESAKKRLYQSNITDINVYFIEAKSKKEAFTKAKSMTPSIFANEFAGIDIERKN